MKTHTVLKSINSILPQIQNKENKMYKYIDDDDDYYYYLYIYYLFIF